MSKSIGLESSHCVPPPDRSREAKGSGSCNQAVAARGGSVPQAGQFLNDILHASAFCLMLTANC